MKRLPRVIEASLSWDDVPTLNATKPGLNGATSAPLEAGGCHITLRSTPFSGIDGRDRPSG